MFMRFFCTNNWEKICYIFFTVKRKRKNKLAKCGLNLDTQGSVAYSNSAFAIIKDKSDTDAQNRIKPFAEFAIKNTPLMAPLAI